MRRHRALSARTCETPAHGWTHGLAHRRVSRTRARSAAVPRSGRMTGTNFQAAGPVCSLRTGNRTGPIVEQGSTEQAKSRAPEERQLIPPGNRPALAPSGSGRGCRSAGRPHRRRFAPASRRDTLPLTMVGALIEPRAPALDRARAERHAAAGQPNRTPARRRSPRAAPSGGTACQWQPKTAHFRQLKTAHFSGGRLGRIRTCSCQVPPWRHRKLTLEQTAYVDRRPAATPGRRFRSGVPRIRRSTASRERRGRPGRSVQAGPQGP